MAGDHRITREGRRHAYRTNSNKTKTIKTPGMIIDIIIISSICSYRIYSNDDNSYVIINIDDFFLLVLMVVVALLLLLVLMIVFILILITNNNDKNNTNTNKIINKIII